jgi:predicted metal-dependent hydrolase
MRFEYEVRHSGRAQRIRLTIKQDKRIVLTLPVGVPERLGKLFVKSKRNWIINKLTQFEAHEASKRPILRQEYLQKKEIARKKITPAVEEWARRMGLQYNRIAIKNTTTRWGSCSTKKNLNFHYQLAFIEEDLMEYVIIHELCHLKHMHHSYVFWKMVETWCPEWRERRKRLRRIALTPIQNPTAK